MLHPNEGYFEPILPFAVLDQPFCAVKLFPPELQTGDGAPSQAAPSGGRSSCSPRDIPGVFTHLWKSRSVCLPLRPQHKHLHPQINNTRAGAAGAGCSSCARLEGRRNHCLFACLYLRKRRAEPVQIFACAAGSGRVFMERCGFPAPACCCER